MINKNQSGRTMMEMLGVLAIIGIITYGAISGVNSGMTSYKINQMYVEIGNIIKGIQDMCLSVYGKNAYPSSLNCNTNNQTSNDCKTLKENGILNSNVRDLNITFNGGQLTLTYTAKNYDICKRLSEMDWAIESIECKYNDDTTCTNLPDENHPCKNNLRLEFSPK